MIRRWELRIVDSDTHAEVVDRRFIRRSRALAARRAKNHQLADHTGYVAHLYATVVDRNAVKAARRAKALASRSGCA